MPKPNHAELTITYLNLTKSNKQINEKLPPNPSQLVSLKKRSVGGSLLNKALGGKTSMNYV